MDRLSAFACALALSLALAGPSAVYAGSEQDAFCDRSGDFDVTAVDALIALQDAVDTCETNHECDNNGDGENTATDALVLLGYAVGLPVDIVCECVIVDECFGDDEDCVENGFPEGYRCTGSLCVECIEDTDCADGSSCDTCHFQCVVDD